VPVPHFKVMVGLPGDKDSRSATASSSLRRTRHYSRRGKLFRSPFILQLHPF